MSQKSQIIGAKVTGPVFLGVDGDGRDIWSADPSRVLRWMTDGWRTRFNQHRSMRHKYVYGYGDQVGADAVGRVLVPIGSSVTKVSDKQARELFPHLRALPMHVLQSPEKVESTEWFAAVKRRKTNQGNGRKAGRMPSFQSRKRDDARFVCWYNGGKNATYRQTGKRSGILTIRGMNPGPTPGGKQRWQLKLRLRHTQTVLDYTSVQVNTTRGEVAFTSAPKERPHKFNGEIVGIDVGVANTVATSHGALLSLPDLAPQAGEVARHQKRMAKSRRVAEAEGRNFWESRRYQAHKAAAAAAYAKAARVREDWAHKVSNDLVTSYDIIGLENLQLRNMTRKGRGKRGLNRAMLNAGLGQLRNFITYKGITAGIEVIAVNPKNTSRRCRPCGRIAAENRESQAVFECVTCGYRAHADINAAGNIEDDALAAFTTARTMADAGSVTKTRPAQAGMARATNRKPPASRRRPARAHSATGNPRP